MRVSHAGPIIAFVKMNVSSLNLKQTEHLLNMNFHYEYMLIMCIPSEGFYLIGKLEDL